MAILNIKSVTITEKGQIAIPKEIRELEGFQEGDRIALVAYEDKIEIRPLSKVSEKLFTTFASEKSLAKDWNSKEDEEAWKNL